jgi:hypothetical protein
MPSLSLCRGGVRPRSLPTGEDHPLRRRRLADSRLLRAPATELGPAVLARARTIEFVEVLFVVAAIGAKLRHGQVAADLCGGLARLRQARVALVLVVLSRPVALSRRVALVLSGLGHESGACGSYRYCNRRRRPYPRQFALGCRNHCRR